MICVTLPYDREFNGGDREGRRQGAFALEDDVVITCVDGRGDQSAGDDIAYLEHVLRAVRAIGGVHHSRIRIADRVSHADRFTVLGRGRHRISRQTDVRHSVVGDVFAVHDHVCAVLRLGSDEDQVLAAVVSDGQVDKAETGDRSLIDRQGRDGKGVALRFARGQRVVVARDIGDFDLIDACVGRGIAVYDLRVSRETAMRGFAAVVSYGGALNDHVSAACGLGVNVVAEAEGLGALSVGRRSAHRNGMREGIVDVSRIRKAQAGQGRLIDDPVHFVGSIKHVVIRQFAIQADTRYGGVTADRIPVFVDRNVDRRSIIVVKGHGAKVAGRADQYIVCRTVHESGELHALQRTIIDELRHTAQLVILQRTTCEVTPIGADHDRSDHEGLRVTAGEQIVGSKIGTVILQSDRHGVGADVEGGKPIDLRTGPSRHAVRHHGAERQALTGDDAVQREREAYVGASVMDTIIRVGRNCVGDLKRNVDRSDVIFRINGQNVIVRACIHDCSGIVLASVLDVLGGDALRTRAIRIVGIGHAHDRVVVLRHTRLVFVRDHDIGVMAVAVIHAATVHHGHVRDIHRSDREEDILARAEGDVGIVRTCGEAHNAVVFADSDRIRHHGVVTNRMIGKGRSKGVAVASQAVLESADMTHRKRLDRLIVRSRHVIHEDIIFRDDRRLGDREGRTRADESVVIVVDRREGDAVLGNITVIDQDVDRIVIRSIRAGSKGRAARCLDIRHESKVDRLTCHEVIYSQAHAMRDLVVCDTAAYARERGT